MGDWKLIEWFEDDSIELFNLADDIGETGDLAQSQPERAATQIRNGDLPEVLRAPKLDELSEPSARTRMGGCAGDCRRHGDEPRLCLTFAGQSGL